MELMEHIALLGASAFDRAWKCFLTVLVGVGAEYWWTYMRADSDGLAEIRRLSEAGKLKQPVEKTFPFAQVKEAHEAKDTRKITGKVVLELD